MGKRFLSFVVLFTLTFFAIAFTSEFEQPLLYLTRFSYLPATLIVIAFILMIGHEVIFLILQLTTPYIKTTTSNNTVHFIVLSVVYLLNLVVIYLQKIRYIDWDLHYINQFILLAVSAALGVWGLKAREERYKGIFAYYPLAIFLYLCLALITFSTLLFQSLNANDPFLEAIGNIILYSHIGFGSMFFIYIIANFINQLIQGLPVHQFVFKEDNFPYVTSRLAGTIIVAGLFFRMNYAGLALAIAGFYNGMGDLSLQLGKEAQANFYYQKSKSNSINNHHANFALSLTAEKPAQHLKLIKSATIKQPSPFAYASLGKAYENNNQFFEAIFAYQEGLSKFPGQWALQNNLALLYNKTSVVDSALYYLNLNDGGDWQNSIINTNIGAVCTMHGLDAGAYIDTSQNLSRFDVQSNLLVNKLLFDKSEQPLDQFIEPGSTTLNIFTYSYLKNLGVNTFVADSKHFIQIIDKYLKNPQNVSFREDLRIIKAINLYANGRVADAFDLITQIRELNEGLTQKWDVLLGKWCLELNAPFQASKYFELAREEGYPLSLLDLGQAYSQIDKPMIAEFLLMKESMLDSLPLSLREEMSKASQAYGTGLHRWKGYDFTASEQLLDRAQKADLVEAEIFYDQLGYSNPFFESGVIAAAQFFSTKGKDKDHAYDILQKALAINEYSEMLIKAYIDHALTSGLTNYAESALIRLIDVMSIEAYEAYEVAFEVRKIEAENQGW